MEIAKVQSTEASNAIEGIITTNTRIRQLVEEKTTPRNRDEQEIAKEFASPQSSGFVTDVGMWRLSLLNEAGQSFKYEGSLVSHGDNDLLGIASAELRKILSMPELAAFDGMSSEG